MSNIGRDILKSYLAAHCVSVTCKLKFGGVKYKMPLSSREKHSLFVCDTSFNCKELL